MSRLHIIRSLMCAGLISAVLGTPLTGIATHAVSAKLLGDSGSPRGESIHAVLTSPLLVPLPVSRTYSAKVIMELEVIEKEMQTSEGVSYIFRTLGSTVPGSFIRVRQGGMVEFHSKNHLSSEMPHNIDLHGVTGSDGGAVSSSIVPGHESQFTSKALNEGIYVHHCATALAGMYIANGMYSLILVEPPEGLPKVDHEYYVMQGGFYTVGRYRERDLQPSDMEKATDERPSYVLFNGAEGALTGDKVLHAKVGETVRILVGNGGSNLAPSFYVIGAIFDQVCYEGGTNMQRSVQTILIPAGGAAVVKFTARVSGSHALVDHSIFRALNKGVMAILKIDGAENKPVYSGKELDSVYLGDRAALNMSAVIKATQASVSGTLAVQDQVQVGRALFAGTCPACHRGNGAGLSGMFSPFAKSDLLVADPKRAMSIVLHGLNGKIKVNGQEYDSVMPPVIQLNDGEVANILTYVLNSWDNPGSCVNTGNVRKVRAQSAPARVVAEH